MNNFTPRGNEGYPFLDPGELRHQITFQKQTVVQDESGAGVQWKPTALIVRAKIAIISVTQKLQGGQNISQTVAVFTIRWDPNPAIANTARFIDENGATWIIEAIDNIGGRNVKLEMLCIGYGENNS